MPRAIGAKPGLALSGFTHTTRWATRCRRRTCSASTSGSPRSQPSERITTTAPRARPRSPHRSLNVRRPSPSRVPPDQSSTAPATASSAASGSRERSSRVMRVQRVPSVNTSTCGAADHGHVGEAHQRAGVGLHRAGHVAQQHHAARPIAGAGGGRCAAARRRCAAPGGWWRPRRSGRAGGCVGRWRREARRAPTRRRSPISRWASSSSAALQRAKSLACRSSRSVQRRAKAGPSIGSGSPPSSGGGSSSVSSSSVIGLGLGRRSSLVAVPACDPRTPRRRPGRRRARPRAGARAWRGPPSRRTLRRCTPTSASAAA